MFGKRDPLMPKRMNEDTIQLPITGEILQRHIIYRVRIEGNVVLLDLANNWTTRVPCASLDDAVAVRDNIGREIKAILQNPGGIWDIPQEAAGCALIQGGISAARVSRPELPVSEIEAI